MKELARARTLKLIFEAKFAASWSQIDICRFLLQHGAAVGINASASDLGWYAQ